MLMSTLFILLPSFLMVCGDVFYISEVLSLCPQNTNCNRFSDYLNFNIAFKNDSIYYFFEGKYYLSNTVTISYKANLTLQGLSNMEYGANDNVTQTNVTIICTDSDVRIFIRDSENIKLANLTLVNCSLSINSVRLVRLEYTSIQDSPWIALHLFQVCNITIIDSSFTRNGKKATKTSSIALIVNKSFLSNCNCCIINVNVTNIKSTGVYISLNDTMKLYFISLFLSNDVDAYGIVAFFDINQYELKIFDFLSTGGHSALYIEQAHVYTHQRIPFINITNAVIKDCIGNGVVFVWNGPTGFVQIASSLFYNNTGNGASALYIAQFIKVNHVTKFNVQLSNLTFNANSHDHTQTLFLTNDIVPSFDVTVALILIKNISITNCTFSNNNDSGLLLYESMPTFYGNIRFINNTGENGGGIFMISVSVLLLDESAYLVFINNHAKNKGGAICITQLYFRFLRDQNIVVGHCFYDRSHSLIEKKYFYFENNSAGVAGYSIYGSTLSLCSRPLAQISIGAVENNYSDYSIISSDARDICFCNENIPICNESRISVNAFPGETITIPVVAVGDENGTTTGVVSIIDEYSFISYDSKNLSPHCTNIPYKIKAAVSTETSINIIVTLSHHETNFIPTTKNVSVKIQPCPHGFYVSNITGVCECLNEISEVAMCNTANQTVTRSQTTWLGYDFDKNCTVVSKKCRSTYCNVSYVTLQLSQPDTQCKTNRTGRLCGKCSENLSLVLGSDKCKLCDSNKYITLIIPFALAGVVLVTFLIALNLTVSVGTINGLIFFANIVKLYQPLFPFRTTFPVAKQFIDWINLDLGFQICFFAGMDSCQKMGLQFVFAFYVWFLIAVIILMSRWSSKLTKAVGNNAVPVLATLLLLSYTKLLRTIILILTPSKITCIDKSDISTNYWSVDATIPYATNCHLPLFATAMFFLIVLVIPYILFLLFFPFFEVHRPKWKITTRLFLNLKPVMDAYGGPHTDKFRCWPGVLAASRVMLALSVTLSYKGTSIPFSILVAITTTLIISLNFCKIYKSQYYHILDIWYLLSLLIIAYITEGSLSGDDYMSSLNASIGVAIVLGIGLLLFLVILLYHILYYFAFLKWLRKRLKARQTENTQIQTTIELARFTEEAKSMSCKISSTTINIIDYSADIREPLLESLPE